MNGFLEVAGPRTEVVIANVNGLSVNGGGFINTSRAILTTGTPNYGPNGSLAGFTVNGGAITVQGAGLDASQVDQVDLLSRAIQVNAAIYAKNLNVVAGANNVDHDSLSVTPIAGNGPAPALAIDVSQLGGMYANRIWLASNEYGLGVSTRGVLASQAGDLTLTSNGQLILAGQTNASGSINASAAQGITNSGTTYAQGNVNASTSGTLANSGTLAAQQNTTINAGSVSSTGTLAAGVNGDGSLAQSGDLNVNASGAVTASGRNAAGGNTAISGAALALAGSTNSAKGALVLAANSGDLNLVGASSTAGSTLDARASGTLINDNGAMSSGGAQTVTAGALSNRAGQMVSGGTLTETVSGATNNQGGTMQATGALSSSSGTFDNTAGHVVSLGANGVQMTTTGLLNNGAGGTIGGNGNVTVQAGQIVNAGSITAVQTLIATAVQTLFNSGTFASNANMTLSAGSTLTNVGQVSASRALILSAATFDNSNGKASADLFTLHATNLVNHAGSITQTGSGATTLDVTGTLDNSAGGTLQTNSTDLTLAPGALNNDHGTITHAGSGALLINAGNGAGALSNAGGTIASNGQVAVNGGALNNASGSIVGQNGLTATLGGTLDNTNGKLLSNTDLSVSSGALNNNAGQIQAGANETIRTGSLTNSGGSIVAPNLSVTTTGTLDNSGGDIEANQLALNATNLINHAGKITQYGESATGFNVSGTFDNSNGGTFQTNGTDLTLAPGALINDGGTITHAGSGTLSVNAGNGAGALSNAGGTIASNGQVAVNGGALNNASGSIVGQNGLTATLGGTLDNTNGKLLSNTDLSVSSGALNNNAGQIQAGANETIRTGSLTNSGGSIVAPNLSVTTTGTLDNSGGDIEANQLALNATNLINHAGKITQYGESATGFNVSGTFDNSNGGTFQTNGTDLTLAPGALINDGGTITHAGQGTLSINAGNGAGALSNVGGTIASNGQITAQGGALKNASGSIAGQKGLAVTVGDTVNNANGKLLSNADLSLTSAALNNTGGQIGAASNETIRTGTLTNSGGSIVAPNLTVTSASTLDNSGGDIEANQMALNAADLINHAGTITQYGTAAMGFNVSGTFDNSNGGTLQTNSTNFTLAPGALINDNGTILDAGTGTLTIAPGNGAGYFSNTGGRIITAGQIVARAGSLNNANGVLAAQGNIAATIAGGVNNTQGAIRSLSSLSLASGGALTNTNGQIQSGTGAAGDASMLGVQAASIDNTNGLVGDLGTGDTTVQGGSQIVNTGGVMTGNGNVTVNTAALVNTQNAQLSGANVAVHAGTVDNSGGQIGTLAGSNSGSNGDVAITTTGTVTNTNGQIGATHDLSVNAAALTGGGAYSAANDVAVSVQGDFAPTPDFQFNAGHNLAFTLPGTFTNGALVQAVNNLDVNAADVQNTGTMMAGGTLTTHSATLTNTGVIVGGSVSLNATQTLSNVGPTALIGATDSNGTLELLAPDIENRDDTTMTDTQATTAVYGLGKVVLAGGKNADGTYTNANVIRNQSALIESAGDMELHANQVTNTRTTVTTTGFNQPVDPTVLDGLGISLSGCISTNMVACSAGHPFVGWLNPDPNFIGGLPPDPPHGGQWNSGWQYTTYTGVALANLIEGISPQAQIVAGGNLDASKVGNFQNYWSAVAAAGNIAAPVSLDQNSWQGQTAPGIQVTYSGYFHYRNYDGSIADWTLPFGDAPFVGSHPGGYTQVAPADIRTYALPAYESSFVAGGTLAGTGISINNTAGNAGIPSLGLAAGQAISGVTIGGISGNASGANAGGALSVAGSAGGTNAGGASSVAGNAGGTKSGAMALSGGTGRVDPVIATATAQNVLQNITIPAGGLFSRATAPNATYLIATNPAFTNQKNFISSDYFLQQLDLDPQKTEKRLGDGFYEQQLVRNQITSLTGKAVLGPYTDTQAMYEALMDAGASLMKSLNLPLGMSLSPEQVAALTSNVVIMQTEIVDGQSVLVPVVYLAKPSQQNMNGPLIAATDIDIKNAQTFANSGTVQAGNTLSIQGNQINNAFGTLQSGGLMSLTTKGNIDFTSATVNAGSLALNAGGNLILNTAVNTVNQVIATGATRTTATLGPIASLNVAGNAAIVTGGDFIQNAGNLNVGGNLGMLVGGNYDLGSVQTGEHKVVERANGVSNTNFNQTTGSSVKVGGVSQIGVGGDLTATGAKIDLGGGGLIVAKGDVTLQAAKATSTVDSNSSGSDSHGSYSESLHRSDDTLISTTLNAGNSLTVVSGKDINVIGSSVSLDKGTATLAAAGNVSIGAATETHVDNSQEQHSHSNVVSSTEAANSSSMTETLSQGSMISADGVAIASGKDITVTGSTIVGTNNVSIAALGNVDISAARNYAQDNELHDVKHSGISGSGGLGVTIGSSEQKDAYNSSGVTQSQSRSTVGSVQGNVSISAGKDLHIGGSDIVAGQAAGDVTGATGNIALKAQNVTIDPGQDSAHAHDQQDSRSSGMTLAVTGTPFDTVRNVKDANASGNGYQRARGIGNELAASALDTPSVTATISHSSSSTTTDVSSVTNTGSTIRGAGNVSVTATGGALMDANGHPLDGDITVTGSTISAGRTASFDANRNVTLQASTDQMQQSSQSQSSSSSLQIASPSLGDVHRWVNGGPNNGGVSSSPYNAASAHSNGNGTSSTQTASVVTGNNVTIVSHTGDVDVIGSGIVGTQGVDLLASHGSINVLAGVDTSTSHQDESRHQFGDLGSNGVGTGFSQGVSNSHRTQDEAAQTQSTIRSQIVSGNGSVTAVAKDDINVQGSDLTASKDLTLIGRNVNLDAGADATQSQMSQSMSQYGVTFALGGVAGDTVATVNRSMTAASQTHDKRLAALDVAQAALAVNGAPAAAASGQAPLIKATVSVGGGSSQSEMQSDAVAHNGSTLTSKTVTIMAAGSGTKDASGYASDGDINSRGTTITGENVTFVAARDVNLLSAQDMSKQSGSNGSSNASIGIGLGLGGQQNGFTVELAASGSKGHLNGNGVTNVDTQVNAGNALTISSGRDSNLIGAQAAGGTVNVDVGRNLTITSPQDTNVYDSRQTSAGMQASICVPPLCFGQGVTGSASVSDTKIDANYASVNRQSGLYAGEGGFNVNVREHTQLDGGAIASTATADKNTLSTGSLGFSDVQNHADYSGSSVGFSASTTMDKGAPTIPGIAGMGPTGFGAAGTSSSASGTTHAVVSPGTIVVRDDAGTGHDSTAGLSRDAAHANGSVINSFDAQKVADGMAIQQAAVQVGMQAAGDVADKLEKGNPSLWGPDGAGRTALHGAVAAAGAAMGGGNVAGALAGTVAGDLASSAVNGAMDGKAGATLAGNIAAGATGAAAGGAIGGAGGAMSGANGALGADLYNRQLHQDSKAKEKTLAKELAAKSSGKYTQAEIEDQMQIMGGLVGGDRESGAPATLIGQMPTDSGAKWQYAGTTDDGKPILTQIMPQPNPELQNYILANSGSAQGGVPSIVYDQTGKKGFSVDVTGPFTKFDKSDADYMRGTVSDVSSSVSTNAGRFGAATAALATIPSPYSAGFSAAAYLATVTGFAADAIGQTVKPDVGQYTFSGVTGLIVGNLSDRSPALGPAINETANAFSNSKTGQQVQSSVNQYWTNFVNYWSNKR
ncbi:filamentous hemagglutinin family outer membrane protein [Burkholderia sp. YI23]|nr:filamentous hemagglutinin family outer membrane protein [Burkholderia sp. YI23]